MKLITKSTFLVLVIGVLFYISCKKEYSCEGCIGGNKPPIANAGADQVITLPTDSVSLDGNASSDPDGTISSFLWTKISGPASYTINNSATVRTVVKNLGTGLYQFELKVTDNGGLSAKDTMRVIVNDPAQPNRPPVARAGADQSITLPANTVTLDGSASSDPDNNITGYAWTKISGPSSFNIVNANAVQTQATNLVQGVYQFELKVADGEGLISKDTMLVNVSDTLSGREFIFDGLTWELGDFYGLYTDDIYVGTPARSDLFPNSNGLAYYLNLQNGEVYIKFDTAANWIQVTPFSLYQPGIPGPYLYDIASPHLYVHAYPLNYQLVGTRVSIKVKFL